MTKTPYAAPAAARPNRWTTLVLAGAALVSVTAGAVLPASAAEPQGAAAAGTARAHHAVDTAALTALMKPGAMASGTMVRVGGTGPGWTGATGPLSQDPAANFRIGSITKLFTSTLVLQLAGEGRFTLDTPVQELLPGTLPSHWKPITVGQLLSHTSGIQEPCIGFADGRAPTPEQVVSHWTDPKCAAPRYPVLAQQYNGANYFLLGMVVEKVTGRSYADEIQRRIARPLGLRHTYSPERGDRTVPGPVLADGGEIEPWAWAEGGMLSNAPDLERFMTGLLRGRLLKPAQQRQLFAMPALSRGAADRFSMGGLMRAEIGGTVVWGKTGSMGRSTSGVFATEGGRRTVVYSLLPASSDRELMRRHVAALVGAAL
ncbi:serine hydrolase domain-containing protein [Streptomyces xanthophaeus]|uniref:serine hydrolase domain-containing protein n=1 Tax=Streptomyces xanthophaeus TaxID=67385 RepID=UPI002648CB88|nr:serine hydrolase domain-containing protein [Streptomyces xanthophaeus]WKD32993.1 beta-lactamase family protein [Streptomyces xanthophaeus]